jgi:hypothetical protein
MPSERNCIHCKCAVIAEDGWYCHRYPPSEEPHENKPTTFVKILNEYDGCEEHKPGVPSRGLFGG